MLLKSFKHSAACNAAYARRLRAQLPAGEKPSRVQIWKGKKEPRKGQLGRSSLLLNAKGRVVSKKVSDLSQNNFSGTLGK